MSRSVNSHFQGSQPTSDTRRYLDTGLGAITALLYILAFPNWNFPFMAWVALMPLLYVIQRQNPQSSFFVGWISGTMAHAGLLYWILVTFKAAGQSVWLAVPCWLLLSAYLGLFWGAWSCALTWAGCTPFRAAMGWVALEYLRTSLFSGFPWTLLADSQWQQFPLIQIASVTGVYGISFLIVLVNATIIDLALKKAGWKSITVAVTLLIGCALYGNQRIRSYSQQPLQAAHKVSLLQGNIDQYEKWDARYVGSIQRTYETLTSEAARQKPALIVWPETSVPGYLLQDPALKEWLLSVVRQTGTHHLVGAPSRMDETSAYNSAFLLDPTGQITGQYDKQHLVPFGEVIPLGSFLGRWIKVLNELGGFTAGTRLPVMDSSIGLLGVNICYEAIFPALVRESVLRGAQVIVNLTNDGWYMQTSAPYQHFIPNVFRAVENYRWVIRANNTGITGFINPLGQVVAASPIFVKTTVTATVVPQTKMTLYTQYGNVFAGLCAVLCLIILLRAILRQP